LILRELFEKIKGFGCIMNGWKVIHFVLQCGWSLKFYKLYLIVLLLYFDLEKLMKLMYKIFCYKIATWSYISYSVIFDSYIRVCLWKVFKWINA